MPMPLALRARAGWRWRRGLPSISTSPVTPRSTPNSASSSSRWPWPSSPPRPTTSPARTLQRDVLAGGRSSRDCAPRATGGSSLGARAGLRREDVAVFAADHHLDDLVVGLGARRDRSRRCGRCGTPCIRRRARRSRACGARCRAAPDPSARSRFSTPKTLVTSAAVSADVASSRMRMRGLRASALAISTICRRDSGRSLTSASGWMSSRAGARQRLLGDAALRPAVDQPEAASADC